MERGRVRKSGAVIGASTVKRSSPDNPPRVGMVVRFARYQTGLPVSQTEGPERLVTSVSRDPFCYAATHDGSSVNGPMWINGQYDIISEPREMDPSAASMLASMSIGLARTEDIADTPCNCAQSLALADALRRIVSTLSGEVPAVPTSELVRIAKEALK